jgi:peptidoglycan hydrolase-like protein with peptidoglycan-binding domain
MPTIRQTIRINSRGPDVVVAQRLLNNALRPPPHLAEDGHFGAMTQNAVIRFQRQASLVADGVVGPATWRALSQRTALPDPTRAPAGNGGGGSRGSFADDLIEMFTGFWDRFTGGSAGSAGGGSAGSGTTGSGSGSGRGATNSGGSRGSAGGSGTRAGSGAGSGAGAGTAPRTGGTGSSAAGRSPLLPNFAGGDQAATVRAMKEECIKQGVTMAAQIAYLLATAQHESSFQPIREGNYLGERNGRAERFRRTLRYYPYYGRGYVQLTWRSNYEKYGRLLGLDMVNNLDLALEPAVALFVIVHGMRTGGFTGKKLSDYINSSKTDFVRARYIINGQDRAALIAGYAETWLRRLQAEGMR